jgi:hypothetical protein
MNTKLEAMVDHLAGRAGDPRILDELADPTSEASRFLEATHARSRALLEEPVSQEPGSRPRLIRGKSRWIVAAIASAGLLLLGFVSWLADARLRRLEASLERSEAATISATRKLEEALARLAEPKPPLTSPAPIEAAIGRVEADLTRIERRIDALDGKPEPTKADLAIVQIRDELVTLRREFSSAEKARARQADEHQTSMHEVSRILRLLLSQSQSSGPAEEAVPPAFPPSRPPSGGDPRRKIP